jgi:hypothetical protein
MKQFKAKHKGRTLLWFWSDVLWYVTCEPKRSHRGPPPKQAVGVGKTRDKAFFDLMKLEKLAANPPIGQ